MADPAQQWDRFQHLRPDGSLCSYLAKSFCNKCGAFLSPESEAAHVDRFNRDHPVGTPVLYWPGVRGGDGRVSKTRTPAWLVGERACVSVDGYPGGIALTHVEVASSD